MPTDHLGQPRHNQVVFVEEGDEHGATVGRAHASIRWDADRREYRLFDDGSHNGTRIVRAGVTIPVSPRDPVGVTVRSGDEIQFGTAAVRVEVGGDATRGSA
jgi:pSer/pThr/pTyr-binding forkhead associated (FHA) protein